MSVTTSLFLSPAADVTLDRVSTLVAQNLPESLTLEYKERFSSSLVTTVAAMANSYGGLILVGVTDQPQGDRLTGVPEQAIVQIVNACHDKLEPPWEPEIIPVPLGDGRNLFVLVVRVDAAHAPRPLLVDGAAPIRLQGRNAIADRGRLAQLFSEPSAPAQSSRRMVTSPDLPTGADGSPAADLVVRSGIVLPLGESAAWRPLSERGVDSLAAGLNASVLAKLLQGWCGSLGITGLNPFRRSGFNRARHVRLAWQAVADREPRYPVEAVAVAEMPSRYGDVAGSLIFAVDVVTRIQLYLTANVPWRMPVPYLYQLIDSLLATLTDGNLIRVLADLAAIDPVIVPQPANLFLTTGPAVVDLLHMEGLAQVENAGPSHGAHVLANPSFDLADLNDRRTQVDDWVQQIALDAGLRGMESLLLRYHEQDAS